MGFKFPDWGFLGIGALALLVALTGAYSRGYAAAEAEGRAALAELQTAHATENVARWAEYAASERRARKRLQEEQARADAVVEKLLAEQGERAKERRDFQRRIANATRDTDCNFSADTVRLYNEALYGPGPGAGSANGAGGAAPSKNAAGSPAAAAGTNGKPR